MGTSMLRRKQVNYKTWITLAGQETETIVEGADVECAASYAVMRALSPYNTSEILQILNPIPVRVTGPNGRVYRLQVRIVKPKPSDKRRMQPKWYAEVDYVT